MTPSNFITADLLASLDAFIQEHREPQENIRSSLPIRDTLKPEDDIRYSLPISDAPAPEDDTRLGMSLPSQDTEENRLKLWIRQNRATTFQEDLMRWIDKRGMTDVEFYTAALIDRRLFSRIRSNRFYVPSKDTALACCLALQLELPEAEVLLKKAGLALDHSDADLTVEFCIRNHIYNLHDVNVLLDHAKQDPLRL